MTSIEREKELIFVRLIRKGPHIMEFSNDYLMVHNGKITMATEAVLEKYFSSLTAEDKEVQLKLNMELASMINDEYYKNKKIEWYSLREYIDNFSINRLNEFKSKIG